MLWFVWSLLDLALVLVLSSSSRLKIKLEWELKFQIGTFVLMVVPEGIQTLIQNPLGYCQRTIEGEGLAHWKAWMTFWVELNCLVSWEEWTMLS